MVETRWNSVFLMLERIIEQKEAIVLDLQNWVKNIDITVGEWKLINGYVEILKPVLEATKKFRKEDIPTFSMVNPLIYTIETKLNNFIVKNSNTAAGLGFARNLKKSISNRFQACKNDPAYLLATAIDPRFKTILMESYKVENVKRLLTTEVESLKLTSYTELKTTEQNIQPITVPVPTNTLWDILQERSISITGNEGLTSCVKNEVRSLTFCLSIY